MDVLWTGFLKEGERQQLRRIRILEKIRFSDVCRHGPVSKEHWQSPVSSAFDSRKCHFSLITNQLFYEKFLLFCCLDEQDVTCLVDRDNDFCHSFFCSPPTQLFALTSTSNSRNTITATIDTNDITWLDNSQSPPKVWICYSIHKILKEELCFCLTRMNSFSSPFFWARW